MKQVKLTIIYKKIQRMNETSSQENIAEFMTRIISQNKVKMQSSVSLMFLDSSYRLLSLSSKVPDKLLVIAIDIKSLYERNVLLKNKYNIEELEQFIFKVQTILSYKKEQKKIISKEKLQIDKEKFEEIIKPAVVKKDQEEEIKKPSIIPEVKEQESKPTKKNDKDKSTIKYVVLKKKEPKKIKLKNKEFTNVKKNIKAEKKTLDNKPKENKPLKIQMTVKLKKDKSPIVVILKKDKPLTPIVRTPKKEKVPNIIKKQEIPIDSKDESNKQNRHNKQTENTTTKIEEVKHIESILPVKKEKKENSQKIKIVEVKATINSNNKSKEVLKTTEKKEEKTKELKEKKIKNEDKPNKKSNQEESIKKETAIDQAEETLEEKKDNDEQQSIAYTILSPTNEVLYHVEIINETPITVEEMLLQSGLEINNSNGFIESINGIENKGMSGWVFEVNNIPVMVSAAEYVINPSDQITWKYVDFSKMMEEESLKEENSKPLIKQDRKGKRYEKKIA